ncbi:hypothetical protein CRM22_004848 [Opisthorchis felineus]|uniref:Uncharacterized protein n=1 Tax=Opisthorchis felineus TaxID=147828 RepID=A0A4S2M0W8_OPIFE|nr:hypothetical protein CRM22_004848 [Opisthorchis felineus]
MYIFAGKKIAETKEILNVMSISRLMRFAFFLWALVLKQLRVLLKKPMDTTQLKTAQRTGVLLAFVHQAVCSEVVEAHPWFSGCEVERYNFNQFTSTVTPVLVKTKTSALADSALEDILDIEVQLFIINRRLRQDIRGIQCAVDILRDEITDSANIRMRKDKKLLFEAETMMYISTEKVYGMTVTESTYEDSKSALLKHIRGKISPGLLHKEHYLLIYPERQLKYPEWKIIRFRLHYITVMKPEEITFPEQWQVGLQGVIDSLGAADDLGANFQLPVYADHTKEFDILTKEQSEPDACEMVENMLSHLQLGSYKCFPQMRMAEANGQTYMRANALISKAGLEVPEIGVKTDLEFVVLLKRSWGENKYSIYTYTLGPVYGKQSFFMTFSRFPFLR